MSRQSTEHEWIIESDWWEAVLTAGACWRAAKSQPSRAEEWEAMARSYSEEAGTLLAWDADSWRWPQLVEPGR